MVSHVVARRELRAASSGGQRLAVLESGDRQPLWDGEIGVRVTLIETEGRGKAAEIALGEQRLRVVDAISAADEPASPGPVARAKLEVVVIPHLTGQPPAGSAPRKGLEPDHGWRYRAHGEIVSTRPLRADVGPLHLELEHGDAETWKIGDPVSVAIDRIILTHERE